METFSLVTHTGEDITNSMENSPSWEASSSSTGHDIPNILQNL